MGSEWKALDARLKAIKQIGRRIGKGKWGLVGVDRFEDGPDDAGDELYLVAAFGSEDDANKALEAKRGFEPTEASWIADCFYVYKGA